MDYSLLKRLHDSVALGEESILCTVVEHAGSTPRGQGAAMLVFRASIEGTIGGGIVEHRAIEKARKMLEEGRQRMFYKEEMTSDEAEMDGAICGGVATLFLERYGPQEELIILGAGHIGKALARLACTVGMNVLTWDEREEFANTDNIPWGRTLCCPLEEALRDKITVHPLAYVVIVTRGHALDAEAVKLLDGKDCAYIGMVGSRRKIALVKERLLNEGVSETHLNNIYQPIGLPINAETPQEIAVSIMAEIIAVKRNADVRQLRGRFETP